MVTGDCGVAFPPPTLLRKTPGGGVASVLSWGEREPRSRVVGRGSRQLTLRRAEVTAQEKCGGAGRQSVGRHGCCSPGAQQRALTDWGGEAWIVLLVEDDGILSFSLAECLRGAGDYRVWSAKSLAEGQALLRQTEIDAAVLDLALPDGRGDQLLREIRERSGDRPAVMMVTGYGSVQSAIDLLRQGADDCLCKPFELAEVEQRLRALLERKCPRAGAARRAAPAPSGPLSAAKLQVLRRLREGKPDARIADELGLSVRTVQNQVSQLLAALGVANRTEAVALSYRRDLLLGALAEGETQTGAGETPAKNE